MATITVMPSGGNYNSLKDACDNANPGDLVEISGDWTSTSDANEVTISDANLTIQTKSGDQARHGGFDNGGSNYALETNGSGHCMTVNADGVTIDGLIIKQVGTGSSDEGIRLDTGDGNATTIKHCVIWTATQDDQQDGIHQTDGATAHIENCVFIGWHRGGIAVQTGGTTTTNVNSCSFWNCGHQVNSSYPGGAIAIHRNGGTHTVNVHNSWALDCHNSVDSEDYAEGQGSGGGSTTWGISYSCDSDNSIASRDGAGAGNHANCTIVESAGAGSFEVIVHKTTAPFDLRLVDDVTNNDAQGDHSVAIAETLTIPSTDIAGTTRSAAYSVGAHRPNPVFEQVSFRFRNDDGPLTEEA